jgi:hypothetical protein
MIWVFIPDYPEYQISSSGEVRSLDREVIQTSRHGTSMKRVYRGKLLKQKVNSRGYAQVTLSNQEKGSKTINIHAYVAKLFVAGYGEGLVVNHIDGVKLNNVYTNLEWVTVKKENITHAFVNGLASIPFGIESNACKGIVEAVDSNGNVVAVFAGESECRSLGFAPSGVSAVLTGRQKTHKNLYFRRREFDGH